MGKTLLLFQQNSQPSIYPIIIYYAGIVYQGLPHPSLRWCVNIARCWRQAVLCPVPSPPTPARLQLLPPRLSAWGSWWWGRRLHPSLRRTSSASQLCARVSWYGGMAVWGYGSMGVWQHGGMAVWRYGSMEVWQHGGMGVWQHGGMAVWEYGIIEGRKQLS